MPETAVADTGPIFHLSEIGEQGLLNLFNGVTISHLVKTELAHLGVWRQSVGAVPSCLKVERVSAREINEQARALSAFTKHRADLSVAALAVRLRPDVVLTDDLRLRQGLEAQGFAVAGSIAVLIKAFHVGCMSKAELSDRLTKLFDGSTLYTSGVFREIVWSAVKDLPG